VKHLKPGAILAIGMLIGSLAIPRLAERLGYRNEPWQVELYAPDGAGKGVLLAADESSPAIACADAAAANFVCMSRAHFGELVSKFRSYRAACPAPQASP
jgi:hypothetical protein